MRQITAFAEPGAFAAWPANNGLWWWEDGEILTGFVTGPYVEQPGHNIAEPYTNRLLRSTDQGAAWTVETPSGYVGTGGAPARLASPLDFTGPGFALRVSGAGYHGSNEPRGSFYASTDRGRTWSGPFAFTGLDSEPELAGEAFSPRTDYQVLGPREMLVFLSVRGGSRWLIDRAFCAFTGDGGQSFHFRGWMVPSGDIYRSVMPATVHLPDGSLVSALRRRKVEGGTCWIDAFASNDAGMHWEWLSRVGDTGEWNGNPPALALCQDGRLCCVYGDRDRRVITARLSADGGRTWPLETVLRDDFYAPDGEPDLGYPRLAPLKDGSLLAVYYWSTREIPYQHIAATRWKP